MRLFPLFTTVLSIFLIISVGLTPVTQATDDIKIDGSMSSGLFIGSASLRSSFPDAAGTMNPVKSIDPQNAILDPVDLVLDDGTSENNIGIGGINELIWLNRFTPDPGLFPFTLNQVQVYFAADGMVNLGDDIVVVIYENTSGSTDPADGSNWLASFPVTVTSTDAWSVYDLNPSVPLNGPGDVLIGVIGLEVPGTSYWPAALDQTATQERSWAGWWLTSPPPDPPLLPPDNSWVLIDNYFPGNWMIRGYGETGSCINHGDVDLNGELTAADAQSAFYIVLGLLTPTPEQYCAADCDGNMDVTAGDAQLIFLSVLGLGNCADPI